MRTPSGTVLSPHEGVQDQQLHHLLLCSISSQSPLLKSDQTSEIVSEVREEKQLSRLQDIKGGESNARNEG